MNTSETTLMYDCSRCSATVETLVGGICLQCYEEREKRNEALEQSSKSQEKLEDEKLLLQMATQIALRLYPVAFRSNCDTFSECSIADFAYSRAQKLLAIHEERVAKIKDEAK